MKSDKINFNIVNTLNKRMPGFAHHTEDNEVWVIGDVHGCAKQFEEVLKEITDTKLPVSVYQLGDMIDRGPELYKVYELADRYSVTLLIGNHEMNFLTEHDGFKKCNSGPRRITHTLLGSLSDVDREFVLKKMRSSLNYIDVIVGGQSFTLSHAPLHEHFSRHFVESMDVGNGWNYCTCNKPYSPEYGLDNEIVYIHGHQHWNYSDIDDQLFKLQSKETSSLNIDSGCVYGKELIAVRLNDHKVVRSNCDIDYS